MTSNLHGQIHENLDHRETEHLLKIWRTNNRLEWSDEAFDAIAEILCARGIDLPPQNEPILEPEDAEDDTYGLSDLELRFVDDENPPEFYDPLQVLKLGNWLESAAIVSVVLAVAVGLMDYRAFQNMVLPYFARTPNANVPVLFITLLLVLVQICLQFLMTYFPLKVLAHVLRILLEMEYNSRKAAPLAAAAATGN